MELDAEARAELASVVVLEPELRRRQRRPERVVGEVEGERRAGPAIAELVQPAQRRDRAVEGAAPPLPVEVRLRLAGQAGDDLDPPGGEELGEILEPGLAEDG